MVLASGFSAASRSPLPQRLPLPQRPTLPETGVDEQTLLADLEQFLAHSLNPANPAYIGHMDPPAATFSLLGGWPRQP